MTLSTYARGAAAGASGPVPDPGTDDGGRNIGRYVTTSARKDIPTDRYAGWLAFFRDSALSPNQVWIAKTTDAQPTNLFLVNMAAIGRVLPKVLLISLAFSLATGCWYGMTKSGLRISFLTDMLDDDCLWWKGCDAGIC